MEKNQIQIIDPSDKEGIKAIIQKTEEVNIFEEGDITIHDETRLIQQLLNLKESAGKNIIVFIDKKKTTIERPIHKSSYEDCIAAVLEKAPIPREQNIHRDIRLIAYEKQGTISAAARFLGISRSLLSGWIHKDDPDKNIELED